MALTEALSTEEQAQLDAMRAADSAPIASAPEPVAPEPVTPASEPTSAEPAAAEPAVAEEPKMVRQEALREERDRRKEADQRNKVLEERLNMLIQRFPQPQTQPAPQQPTAPEIPDVNKDPMGHLVGVLQQMGMNQQQLSQAVQQQQQANQQQAALADLQRRAAAAEQEFRGTTPDYDNAVQYAMQKRSAQLEIAGVSDPAERLTLIQREGLQLAAMAQQQGRNPAAVLYDMAKAYGYATPAAAASAAAEPAATDTAAATERLQTLAAGQQQARSLSNVRGTPPQSMPPAQVIAALPDREFAARLAELEKSPDKFREIFGA